jgi:hypothetical protein
MSLALTTDMALHRARARVGLLSLTALVTFRLYRVAQAQCLLESPRILI